MEIEVELEALYILAGKVEHQRVGLEGAVKLTARQSLVVRPSVQTSDEK